MNILENYEYFKTEFGVLYKGDNRDILPLLKKNSIDLILTDPPYNLNDVVKYNFKLKGRKAISSNFGDWNSKCNPYDYYMFKYLLKESGNIAIFTPENIFGDWYNLLNDLFERIHFFVWHKTDPVPQQRKVGFLSACELILLAWNKTHTFNFITQKEMHNFFESGICKGNERTEHTTQKPLALIEKLLIVLSNEKSVILDPFAGSGTSAIACENLNRKWVCIEKEEKYCEIIKNRLSKKNGKEVDVRYGVKQLSLLG